MLKIISNGSKWNGQEPDTIEQLKDVLKTYTLDPIFEKYGNFINRNPQWLKSEAREKYKGCVSIYGNFLNYSHGFNIITDDEKLINDIQKLVNQNKKTLEYKNALSR